MKFYLPVVLLFIFSIPAILPLFQNDFPTTHDGVTHVVRFLRFDEALLDGQFPPRWANGIAFNLGSPVLMFNAPLPYFAAEIPRLFGASYSFSIEIIFAFAFIASGIAMYFFLKDLFGYLPAFLGALLYIWAPYRFIDLYVRGAYPEHFAFMSPQLILFSFKKIIEGGGRIWFFLGVLSISGLILSHNVMFVLFGSVPILYSLILAWKLGKIRNYKLIFLSFTCAIFLTSFYLLPAFFEKSYTNLDKLITEPSFYNNFISIDKIIYSRWGWGPLSSDSPMSLQLGFAQWLTVLGSMILFLTSLRGVLRRSNLAFRKIAALTVFARHDRGVYFVIFFPLIVLSIFLMTSYSAFIWERIPLLAFFLYPWRFLSLAIFCVATLGAFLIYSLPNKFKKVAIFGFVVLLLYSNRNHLQLVGNISGDDSYYKSYTDTSDIWGEFLPRNANLDHVKKCKVEKCIYEKFDAPVGVEIKKIEETSKGLSVIYKSEMDFKGIINTYYFPGLSIYLDEKEIASKVNELGTMGVELPRGEHNLVAKFKDTTLRKISNYISLSTLIILFLYVAKIRYGENLFQKISKKT